MLPRSIPSLMPLAYSHRGPLHPRFESYHTRVIVQFLNCYCSLINRLLRPSRMTTPQYQSAKQVLIKTGNILNSNDLMKNPAQKADDELCDSIEMTIKNGGHASGQTVVYENIDEPVYSKETNTEELITTVKIFLNVNSEELLKWAIETCLSHLNATQLNTLIVCPPTDSSSPRESILSLWPVLESYVASSKIEHLGLADVEPQLFIDLYSDSVLSIKPSAVQINLAGCCVVPQNLKEFAQEHAIQLLTHGDPWDILPKDRLEELMPELHPKETFVCKFQAHYKCRGILATKGYLVGILRSQ